MPWIAPGSAILPSTILIAAAIPSHQSDGFCSLHRGKGWLSSCGVVWLATTAPVSSISSALEPVVLTSKPSKYLMVNAPLVKSGKMIRG